MTATPEQVEAALDAACRLSVEVRDADPVKVHAYVEYLAGEGLLPAVAVTLAAMVPDDRPVSELLAWTDALAPDPEAAGATT